MDQQQLKSNLTSSRHWLRLLFMLLFALVLQVAAAVMWVIVVLLFLFALVTGQPNLRLRTFAGTLATFIYQCWQFLSYNSEEKPYPFQDWPEAESHASPEQH